MADSSEQVSPHVLTALVKEKVKVGTKVAELNGGIGERIAHHKEHSNLHPGAFAMIAKLHKMDPDKRSHFIDCFELYRDIMEEQGGWSDEGHVGDLLADDGPSEEERDATAAEANEAALRGGINELQPETGEVVPLGARGTGRASYKIN